jgi:hypothetical protein
MALAALRLLVLACLGNDVAPKGPGQSGKRELPWVEDLEEALRDSARDHKPLVVFFMATWCSACKEFEKETLRSPKVLDRSADFRWVRIDVDRDASLIRKFEVRSTPRIDLLDAGGSIRVRISGSLPPEEFRGQLDRLLEEPGGAAGPSPGPSIVEIEAPTSTPLRGTPEGYRRLSLCFSNVGYGPLLLGSQSPFQSLRMGLLPRTPSTLAEGQWEVHWSEAYSNVFIKKPGDYLVQFDLLQSTVSLGYGVANELEVDLAFDNKSRFGGFLDQFIEHFHHAFGLPNQLRDTEPQNAFRIEFPGNQSHPPVDLGNRWQGSFSNSVSLTLEDTLTCGSERLPAIAAGLTLRMEPWGSRDLENAQPVDPGLTVSLAKRIGDFYCYASGLVSYYGHDRFHGIPLRPVQMSGLLAVEWRFHEWASMVFQYQISEGVAEGLGPFGSPANELALGWKIEFAENALVELGAIHTLLNNDNSMDFGIYAGLTVRF